MLCRYIGKTMNRGSGHHKVRKRLTAHDVVIIRRLYKAGFTLLRIANAYGYKPNGISEIVNYKTWKHVEG